MDKKTTQVVVQALVLSRIDYCNSPLIGLAEYQIDKLGIITETYGPT